jgi:hypothetical protein
MRIISICKAAILLVPLLWVHCAHAHGIAGNRYFNGTLTFDDPAVADEAILPYYANLSFPMQDSNVSESRINWAFGSGGAALAPNLATGRFDAVLSPGVETLRWGFSIQYSTYYLTSRFDGGPPKGEPLNQLVPLVEFRFDSPRGQHTAATMNPGFAYVAVAWQFAAEAIVPLNRAGGHGTGFRAQYCSSSMI